MKRKILLAALLALLFLSNQLNAQYTSAKDGIALRYLAPNHLFPISESLDFNDFGTGLEMEYIRHLGPALNMGVPFKIYKAFLPTDEQGGFQQEALLSLDLLLQLKYFRESNFIYPYLFAGFGGNLEALNDVNFAVPLGLGLNFRIQEHAYFSLKGEYRLGLQDLRDNLQLGAGLLFLLGEGAPERPSKASDADGDGVPDENDLCPAIPGLPALNGCPDSDGDGVPDGEDVCPQEAGTAALKGCPDRDGDGVADREDECPDEPGHPQLKGCPIRDADGDGIEDEADECPNRPGPLALAGCPDRDGDGVVDDSDRCQDTAGELKLAGCPDTDGDGLPDPDDRCPTAAGPLSNRGCPEIQQKDRDVLTFAMNNVQFETGKATLRQASFQILNEVAGILSRYPDYKLRISGHTDSVGSAASNQALSQDRAQACYDYLIGQGVAPGRMSYIGYGETRPIANNNYQAGREKNRRVEFDIYLD